MKFLFNLSLLILLFCFLSFDSSTFVTASGEEKDGNGDDAGEVKKPKQNDLNVDDEEEEEDSVLIELTGDNFDELVYRDPRIWIVFVTSTEGCPNCEAFKETVESAARMSKGMAKFGYIDLKEKNNHKILASSQVRVPDVRLYIKPGTKNAYKKNSYFREFVSYTGQQSARGMKRFLTESITQSDDDDMPLVKLESAEEVKDWLKNLEKTKVPIVGFSAKSSTSPMIAALSRYYQNSNGAVAQVSPFSADSEDEGEKSIMELFNGALDKVPSLLVKSGDSTWAKMDADLIQKGSLDDWIKFMEKQVPDLVVSTTDPSSSSSSGEKGGKKKSDSEEEFGLLKSKDQFEKQVLYHRMPVVLALRDNGEETTPQDWKKYREKTHGVDFFYLYCNDKENLKEELKDMCSSATKKKKNKSDNWIFTVYEFTTLVNPEEEGYTPKEPIVVDSLSSARSKSLASIPESIIKINDGNMMQGFISMAVQSKQLPVVLFGKQKDPPAMLIALSAALQGLVLVGYRANPNPSELEQQFGIPPNMPLPILSAMIIEAGEKPEETKIMLSLYDRMRFGKFSYLSMLSFALQTAMGSQKEVAEEWLNVNGQSIGVGVNKDNQDGGPTDSNNSEMDNTIFDDPTKELSKVDTKSDWDSLCTGEHGQLLCVIAFVDGDPLNGDLNSQIETLKHARTEALSKPSAKSKLRFMYVDATCQKDFVENFQVDITSLPTLAVYSPKKGVFFKMFSAFEQEKIERFLTSIVTGFGKNPQKLDTRPKFEDIVCEELESRKIIEDDKLDDEDDEDWLAEIRAEEEREKLEKEAAIKRELKELEEAEKAKKEAATKAKKKRRRRRRKKKTATHDEL